MQNATIESVLREIETQTEYRFFYDSGLFNDTDIVNVSWNSRTVSNALMELFSGREISFQRIDRQIALFVPNIAPSHTQDNRRRAASRHTISGFVRDSLSGESLIRATVHCQINMTGTTTNRFGFYTLTLPAGEVELLYSFVGYNPQTFSTRLSRDWVRYVYLAGGQHLQEIEIIVGRTVPIQETTQMSMVNVPVTQIQSLPAALGEVDVMRALQLMPGIQQGC